MEYFISFCWKLGRFICFQLSSLLLMEVRIPIVILSHDISTKTMLSLPNLQILPDLPSSFGTDHSLSKIWTEAALCPNFSRPILWHFFLNVHPRFYSWKPGLFPTELDTWESQQWQQIERGKQGAFHMKTMMAVKEPSFLRSLPRFVFLCSFSLLCNQRRAVW